MLRVIFSTMQPTAGCLLERVGVGGGHYFMIDEQGILRDWDAQAFFIASAGSASLTIAGRALVVRGTSDGGESDCEIGIGAIRSTIRWIDAHQVNVAAPRETSRGGRVVLLDGNDRWTYNSQPSAKYREQLK
jgi:hypothetical protein